MYILTLIRECIYDIQRYVYPTYIHLEYYKGICVYTHAYIENTHRVIIADNTIFMFLNF